MIIKKIALEPFAGVANQNLVMKSGLNVVLGPNEAGKTTIVNALRMALFAATELSKRDFDKEVRPFLPLKGGDTIQVELDFAAQDRDYRLQKSWGATHFARLRLPEGGILTSPDEVSRDLQSLLVLKDEVAPIFWTVAK